MRHTPCGCCPPDHTAEYSDYLAGLPDTHLHRVFADLKYALVQTKLLGQSKKGASALFLVVLRGIAKAGLPREPSEAIRAGKGGTTKRTRPAACGRVRDVKFVPTQIPLCHSFFQPSTALSFSCEKESAVENCGRRTQHFRASGAILCPPGIKAFRILRMQSPAHFVRQKRHHPSGVIKAASFARGSPCACGTDTASPLRGDKKVPLSGDFCCFSPSAPGRRPAARHGAPRCRLRYSPGRRRRGWSRR